MHFDAPRFFALLADAGLSSPRKQTGQSFVYDCPVCDRSERLYVRKRDGRFRCFYCATSQGTDGYPERLLSIVTGMPIEAARAQLFGGDTVPQATHLNLSLVEEVEDEDVEVWTQLPALGWDWHWKPIGDPGTERGVEYLAGRGIPLGVAQEYQIRYSPKDQRVAFPVLAQGVLVGWQARLIIPDSWVDSKGVKRSVPKILSSAEIPRDRVVMFQDRLRRGESAVMCEGPVDAIKAHLCGGNVAMMGKTVSRGQLDIIRAAGVKDLYVWLDPDAAEEISKIVRDFSMDMEVYVPECPPGFKDPGAMPMELVYEQFRRAPRAHPWRLFLWIGQKGA